MTRNEETNQQRSPKGHKTRTRILAAAESLFTARGFDGASMGDIAAASGVLKSMLYHYFDSKESLWQTIEDQIFAQLPPERLEGDTLFTTRRSLLMEVVSNRYRFLRDHPRVVVFLRYRAERSQSAFRPPYLFPPYWHGAFQHLQRKGAIRPDLDSERTLTLFVASLLGTLAHPYPLFQAGHIQAEWETYHTFLIDSCDRILKP